MCSLDRNTTGYRPISASSVTTMETPPVPAYPTQPIGWDWGDKGVFSKNGEIDGGTALIRKFLPGSRHASDEINVAVTINKTGVQPEALIEWLANAAATADIPEDYDLFDSQYRCFTPPMERLSGTVDLRDDSPKAPACPRPASVGASIRTNKAGPVDYVLACTGQNRTWKGKTVAHKTAPETYIGIVVHPIQITTQEEIICFLRRGEQFGFSDVLAQGQRFYPCQVSGVRVPDPVPPPPGPPGGFVSDPPRFVCIGGRVAGRTPREVCECPRGQETRQTGPNRFECVPQIVCQGGRVAGQGVTAQCVCAPGTALRQVAPNRFACEPQLVCEGGRVVTRGVPPIPSCECPPGFNAQRVPVQPSPSVRGVADTERLRCVRNFVEPGRTIDPGRPVVDPGRTGGGVAVPCRGGTVRGGQCVCPRGQAAIRGVCVRPAQ